MRSRIFPALLPLLFLTGALISAAQNQGPAPVVEVAGLGKGTVVLSQPWQFHVGDDARWAVPDVDDATGHDGWESLLPDKPWGAQGHYAYTGFGWYRQHLHITPAEGVNPNLQVILPHVGNVCEVYWNGALAGRYGTFPPYPSWPAVHSPVPINLRGALDGVLAIRVWQGPLGSSGSGYVGGLEEAPILGGSEAMGYYIGTWNYGFLSSTLFDDALNTLYFLVGLGGIIFWLRHREESLLLWFSIFAISPTIWNFAFLLRLPVSSQSVSFMLQVVWQLRNVALWFLLIDMLNLRKRPALVRWAKVLASVSLAAAFLDGCLTYVPESVLSQQASVCFDVFFTMIVEPSDLYLLVLVFFGFRQKLSPVRMLIGISASLSQLLAVVIATAQQGQRYTHWTLGARLSAPIFHIGPAYFTLQMIFDLLVFFSVLYAVYCYVRDEQARKAVLEQELASARELQEVLIPEKAPALPGFSVSSAYHPALEVGGDFFQIIPLDSRAPGSTLVVLGDVSGKGLRAAMAVSLIVGAVRTLAETTASPAEILAGLSRRLHGRLQGGFTTCLALRLDAGGRCTIASAGHPAPFLNDKEVEIPGALPLGIDPNFKYEEKQIQIVPGDRCALYTDGLLEARSPDGEIFSFERLQELFATAPDAAKASEAAVSFGQEDDITVLTLTRTGDA